MLKITSIENTIIEYPMLSFGGRRNISHVLNSVLCSHICQQKRKIKYGWLVCEYVIYNIYIIMIKNEWDNGKITNVKFIYIVII